MRSFLVALAFLTVVPIRFRTLPEPRPAVLVVGTFVVKVRHSVVITSV